MKKKGFTLVELLAVIAILAVLALLIIPRVSKILNDARNSVDLRSAEEYVKAAENFYVASAYDQSKKALLGTNIIDSLEVNESDVTGKVVVYSNGTTEIALIINNKC